MVYRTTSLKVNKAVQSIPTFVKAKFHTTSVNKNLEVDKRQEVISGRHWFYRPIAFLHLLLEGPRSPGLWISCKF